jgi:hypothetical protein
MTARAASYRTCSCLWGDRFVVFLIESEIYAADQFTQRFRHVDGLLFPLHVCHRPTGSE